jgi:membrane-bound lytic murein transglycosylase B
MAGWRARVVALVLVLVAVTVSPASAQTAGSAGASPPVAPAGTRPLVVEAMGDLAPALLGVDVSGGGYTEAYDAWRTATSALAEAEAAAVEGGSQAADREERAATAREVHEAAHRSAAQAATRHHDARRRVVAVAVAAFVGGREGEQLAALVGGHDDPADRRRAVLATVVEERIVTDLDDAATGATRTAQVLEAAEERWVRAEEEAGAARLARDRAVRQRVEWAEQVARRRDVLPAVAPLTTVARVGLPTVVLDAYVRGVDHPSATCTVPWHVLAGIGRVETRHGRHGGSAPDPEGQVRPRIVGIPLDGTRGTMAVADTDGGALDGDQVWDRAVGPMQFIPSTWRRHQVDGNGDGRADPDNLYDAAATAAVYLCRVMPADGDVRRAVLGYNRSEAYVDEVMDHAAAYSVLQLAGSTGGDPSVADDDR